MLDLRIKALDVLQNCRGQEGSLMVIFPVISLNIRSIDCSNNIGPTVLLSME